MVFLISFVLAAVFTLLCDKAIKKHPQAFYIGTAAIALFFVIFEFPNSNGFTKNYILAIFQKGILATAIFVIVMFTGALKKGSYLIKKLMPIRAQLSIIASILIFIHGVSCGKIYIVRLFTAFNSMPAVQVIFVFFSIVMLVIMVPLAVISFKKIRKKMNAKRWKDIQRFAYVFYGLIYLHVLLIYLASAQKGNTKNIINIIVYSIVFISYAVMRIRKAVLKKYGESGKAINISFGSAGAVLLSVVCALIFVPYAQSIKNVSETVENKVDTRDSDLKENSVLSASENTDTDSESSTLSNNDTDSNTSSSKKITDTDSSGKSTDTDKKENKSSDTSSKDKDSDITSEESNSSSVTEIKTEDKTEENNNNNETTQDEENNEPTVQEQPSVEEPTDDPVEEPVPTKYRDGEYSAKRYGYDGYIYVTVVIENDRIFQLM